MAAITRVEPLHIRWPQGGESAFLRITTDTGHVGYGEASPMYGGRASLQIIAQLVRRLDGADPLDAAVIHDQLRHEAIKLGPGGALAGALAAIDIALWDLKGKLLGQPIHKLLGGAWRTELAFYASVGGNAHRSVDAVCNAVESWLPLKPAMVKIRFDTHKTTRDLDIRGDIAKAAAVRKLVGDLPLAFDANNNYSAHGAVEVGRALEDLGYTWFEEPVQCYDLHGFAQVASKLDIPIAAGEQAYTLQEARALIEAGIRIIQLDIVKTGGFTGLLRVAALCEAFGIDFHPHQTQPTIGHMANLHLLATLLHSHYPAEYNDFTGRQNLVLDTPLEPKEGRFHLTTDPGLGLSINEASLNAIATPWEPAPVTR